MDFPSNAVIGELLATEAGRVDDRVRARALRRAARAAMLWRREARDLLSSGEPLTVLDRVGPWVADEIGRLAETDTDPPSTRAGFLTWTQVEPAAAALIPSVRGDLQAHTVWSEAIRRWPRWRQRRRRVATSTC